MTVSHHHYFNPIMLLHILVSAYIFFFTSAARFPSYLEKCHQSDPNVKQCYLKVINLLRPHFSTGVPEFSLPPIEPLILPEISLESGSEFKAVFENVQIFHLSNFEVVDLDFNLSSNRVEVHLIFPNLRLKSTYHINGKIIFLQLSGSGPADGNITRVDIKVVVQGSRYVKNGREFLKFSKMEIDDTLIEPVFSFDGLFKDNPELTKQTNKILNENIQEIIIDLKPSVHEAISQTVLGLTRRMFEKFSVDELFPE